jgi:hypothetical protein
MFVLFFGGISLHLAALLCHFFSIRGSEQPRPKKSRSRGFRVGLDKIFRDFRFMYCFCIPVIGGMIYLGTTAPSGWTMKDFAVIVPLTNLLLFPFYFLSRCWG